MTAYHFNFKEFLTDKWATPEHLAQFLRTYDVEQPTIHALRKWYDRESVPAEWFAVLVALREMDMGRPLSLAPWLK